MTYPHVPDDDLESALNPEPSHGFGQITDFGARLTGLWTGTKNVDSRLTEVETGGDVRLGYFTITPCDGTKQVIHVGTSPRRCVSTVRRGRPDPDWMEAIENIKSVLNPKTTSDVIGRWIEYVMTPRKSNKPAQAATATTPAKEAEDWTYPKLVRVFKDQAECEAMWQVVKNGSGDTMPPTTAADMTAAEQPMPSNQDANKTALVAAFPVLWTAAQGNPDRFKTSIASLFAPDAPEVAAFIAAQEIKDEAPKV